MKKNSKKSLRFTIRLESRWSARTARCVDRQLNRFEFKDPILGSLCRKAFAVLLGIGEATPARRVATVH